VQPVFFQNPTPRLLTPHFSTLARLFVQVENRDAISAPLERFAAQKIRLRFPCGNRDPK
jgi:hypothetical protein